MPENKWLAEEIVKEAAKIPLESQKHILSVINAMIFTREAVIREQNTKKKKTGHKTKNNKTYMWFKV